MEWRGATLTAYPASHILGAAQLLIEYRGERIVYTGDIKLREPICGATTEIVAVRPADYRINFWIAYLSLSRRVRTPAIGLCDSRGNACRTALRRYSLGIRWVGARRSATYFVTQASRRPFTAPLHG